MHKDRTNITQIGNKTKEANGVNFMYALGDGKTTPLVIGVKSIPAEEGNKSLGGGNIKVIVRATEDEMHKNAKTAKTVEEKAAEEKSKAKPKE